ncbi:MAG: calcium-binding protein, partial [Alphaproteobacteria bacterium]
MPVYTGTSLADTITGSGDADSITAAAGNDSVLGGEGLDTISGGAGADTIDGGGLWYVGDDFVSYASAGAGVAAGLTVNVDLVSNMSEGVGTGGEAAGDVLRGI